MYCYTMLYHIYYSLLHYDTYDQALRVAGSSTYTDTSTTNTATTAADTSLMLSTK